MVQTYSKGHTYTNPRTGQYLTHSHRPYIPREQCQPWTAALPLLGLISMAWPSVSDPSREGGRWETKHFIGMALAACKKNSRGQMRQISRRFEMIHPTIGWRRNEHGTHKHAHGSWILWSESRVRSKTMHSLSRTHYVMVGLHYKLNVRSRAKQLTRGKTKLTDFPRDLTLSVLLYF